jgi:hypothetical protein
MAGVADMTSSATSGCLGGNGRIVPDESPGVLDRVPGKAKGEKQRGQEPAEAGRFLTPLPSPFAFGS